MNNSIQLKITNDRVSEKYKNEVVQTEKLIKEVAPNSSQIKGLIRRSNSYYEGQIHVQSKIGSFVARASSRNFFSLVSKLQNKILRQVVNWREKRRSKKRYHARRHTPDLQIVEN